MANSRKSPPLSNSKPALDAVFQRALEDILARVVVSDRIEFRIALAYSGGLDSTVLLHLAAAACTQRGIKLFAFHVHHGLSPNADRWLAHCEEQAQRAGVAFVARQVQINSHDKRGIEQAARLARYDALANMSTANDVPLLLTAHHQDDQAETVLLQLLRGAGLPGLSAMGLLQPEHALLGAGIALGRPLLEITRADLQVWADTNAITHIVDESNDDLRFRRNEIRHQLMPLLEQQLPGVQKSIARSARHLQTAQRLLDDLAAMDLQSCGDVDSLVLERIRQLSDDRLDNLLRYWLRQRGADHYPSDAQLYQLRQQMLHARDDAHPLLVLCGLRLERHCGHLLARHAKPHPKNLPSEILLPWQGESEIAIPAWQGRLVFEAAVGLGLDRAELLQGPLRLRPRSGSERLKLDPKRPSRTLKNLFQESDVPARVRVWLPLLYLGDELVFAAGLGMDVRAGRASEGICLRWQRQG